MKKILNIINWALAIFYYRMEYFVDHPNKIPVRYVCLHSFPNKKTEVPKIQYLLRSHDGTGMRWNLPKGLSWPTGSCVFITMFLFILEILIPITSFPNLYQKETVLTNLVMFQEIHIAVKIVKCPQKRLVDKVLVFRPKDNHELNNL